VSLKDNVREPFHTIHMDLLGPVNKSNNFEYLAVALDEYSKYCVAFPLVHKSAEPCAVKLYNEVILKHGAFKVLRTDSGGEFRGKVMATLLELMGVKHNFSSGYTSIAQGKIERTLQTVSNALRTMIQKRKSKWADFVQSTVFACNTLPLGDTDLTPFLLLYGRLPCFPTALPPELPDIATRSRGAILGTIVQNMEVVFQIRDEYMVSNQERRLKYINLHKRDSSMEVGSMVFMKKPPSVGVVDNVHRFKWCETFAGPFLVTEINKDNTVILKDLQSSRYTTPVHVTRLKFHEHFDVAMYLAMCNNVEQQEATSSAAEDQ
jgi:transposase InsO family protein